MRLDGAMFRKFFQLEKKLRVYMKNKMRSSDVIRQLGTEGMVEEMQEYKRKWHSHVGRCLPNACRLKHIFMALLEDVVLDVQEENCTQQFL
jgi:hypothetical protein